MRKDIEIRINTGDVVIGPRVETACISLRWVENPTGLSRYAYGEIDVPAIVPETRVRAQGVYFAADYTPKYKEMKVRVRRLYDDGSYQYVANTKDGSEWYLVQAGINGRDATNLRASELVNISDTNYYGSFDGDIMRIYSASQSDFNVVAADRQNANCLLACLPSNNYRYPLSGVGLARWIGSSHIESGDLAETLKREFSEDGVTVSNASYDYETNSIEGLDIHTQSTEE